MPKLTIDGIEFNSEDLSDNGKAQLASLQFIEVQTRKLKLDLAAYETALKSYMSAFKKEIGEEDD